MTGANETVVSPAELRARATRLGRLDQLEVQGYFGGWITEGWATRVVRRYRDGFRDAVLFHLSETDALGLLAEPSREVSVVSRCRFSISSHVGPVVIGDRVLPVPMEDPQERVGEAVASVAPEENPSDGPFRSLLPDDAFWGVIELLGGSLAGQARSRMAI